MPEVFTEARPLNPSPFDVELCCIEVASVEERCEAMRAELCVPVLAIPFVGSVSDNPNECGVCLVKVLCSRVDCDGSGVP
jgi:hypothetical protein